VSRRPFYVTITGLLLLFWGVREVIFLLTLLATAVSSGVRPELLGKIPQPLLITASFLLVEAALHAFIELGCGIGVMRRSNWARLVWAFWCVFTNAIEFATASGRPERTDSFLVIFLELLTVLFLFLPGANRYFVPEENG
jgi:hypothetical protein